MCSGLAESPSSIAVVACIRSAPEMGLSQQPLLTTLLPSLARTTTPLERRRLNVCLYLCAQDDDQFLLDQAKELRRLVASKASFVGMRLGFYPSIHEGLNSAMLCAYADGAKFFHRTFDNVRYTRTDWLGNALGELARGERFIVRPSVATRPPATGWPSLVSRRHLDAFEQFHPPQLHGEPCGLRRRWWRNQVRRPQAVTAERAPSSEPCGRADRDLRRCPVVVEEVHGARAGGADERCAANKTDRLRNTFTTFR